MRACKGFEFRVVASVVASIALLAGGCGGLDFLPTAVPPGLRPKDPAQVQIHLSPNQPFCQPTAVGLYRFEGDTVFNTSIDSLQEIRADAASRGFDGLMDVACAAPGTVGAEKGTCTATAYVCAPSAAGQ